MRHFLKLKHMKVMKNISLLNPLFIIILILVSTFPLRAQERNKVIHSKEAGEDILIGYADRQALEKAPFSQWFQQGYEAYRLKDSLIHIYKGTHLSDMKVTIVGGTWCSDTQRELPRFFKVADAIHIPAKNITMIFVERDKTVPGIDLKKWEIGYVPTFIFTLYGKEVKKIVEAPEGSFEDELGSMCEIIHKNKYYKTVQSGEVY